MQLTIDLDNIPQAVCVSCSETADMIPRVLVWEAEGQRWVSDPYRYELPTGWQYFRGELVGPLCGAKLQETLDAEKAKQ